MRLVLGFVLVACVSAASCDRRPEGPLANHTDHSGQPGQGVTLAAVASQPAAAPEEPRRCMVATAEQATPKPPPAASCPPDPVFGGVTLQKAPLSFRDAPGAPKIEVELARSPAQRQRGLMYRTHMDENAGMLFDFPGKPRVQSFWMRNTCLPLDMLFITEDGFIAGILENVPTMNDASRSIPCPVRYVLEVNAGWTRKHGVKAGQFVELPSPGP